MTALIPFLPGIAGALLGAIPSIVQMARGKGLRRRGGRLMTVHKRRGVHVLRHKRAPIAKHVYRRKLHRGKGFLADIANIVPFFGPMLSGMAQKAGLGIESKHHKLLKKYLKLHALGHGVSTKVHRPYHLGYGISTAVHRPFHGGLLMPAGGYVKPHKTRGHYRRIGHKRVHVKAHKKGGYLRLAY